MVLYKTADYSYRHSGLALEALALGCPLIIADSPPGRHYVQRGFRVSLFSSSEDIGDAISWMVFRSKTTIRFDSLILRPNADPANDFSMDIVIADHP